LGKALANASQAIPPTCHANGVTDIEIVEKIKLWTETDSANRVAPPALRLRFTKKLNSQFWALKRLAGKSLKNPNILIFRVFAPTSGRDASMSKKAHYF
jgi:hypothetical protein